jgi:hypothetical protein
MPKVTGTVRNGMIEFDHPLPPDWADGQRVIASLADEEFAEATDPDSIHRWLDWLDSLAANRMSAADAADYDRMMDERKAEQKELFNQWTKDLEALHEDEPK